MSRFSGFAAVWSGYRRAAAERAAIRQLSGLSDQLLADMGLDRESIREAIRTGRNRP